MTSRPNDEGYQPVKSMEFTGERFVPDIGLDAEIEIEHLQRYLAIKDLVKSKKVLDAASGSGYGTSLLAQNASYACGLDINPEAVTFAHKQHPLTNLHFLRASVATLPLADHSFDVVVSFETIEHIDEKLQKLFLEEIKRVLKPDGLLIISSPEKKHYSDLPGYHNIYHTKEFYQDEFEAFLKGFFPNVVFFRQFLALAYVLQGKDNATFSKLAIKKGLNSPKYLMAICGDQPLQEYPLDCIEIDKEDQYQRKLNRILDLQEENTEKNRIIDTAYEKIGARDATIVTLTRDLDLLSDELRRNSTDVKEKAAHTQKLQEQRELDRQKIEKLAAELDHIRHTKGWRLLQFLYRVKNTLLGR